MYRAGNRVTVATGSGARKCQGRPGSGLTRSGSKSACQIPKNPDSDRLFMAQEPNSVDFDADIVLLDHQVPHYGFEYRTPRCFLRTRDAPQAHEGSPRGGSDRGFETRQNFVSNNVTGEARILVGCIDAGSNPRRIRVLGQTIPREWKERT